MLKPAQDSVHSPRPAPVSKTRVLCDEAAMNTRLLAGTILLIAFALPSASRAETFPYDHMHMSVPDPAKAVEWYIANLGAKHGDAADRVVFGRTIFAFAK